FDPANGHFAKVVKVNAEGLGVDAIGLIGDGGAAIRGAAPGPKGAEDKGQELHSTVHVRWKGLGATFSPGLNTQIEGLALAILGSCSKKLVPGDKGWQAALDYDHVLVTYAQPRLVGVSIDEK